MGFKVKRTVYRLKFQDADMAGVEVHAKSLTTGQFIEFQTARSKAESVDVMSEFLARALVEWNLEDEDGQPIPATLEGLRSLELSFSQEIIKAWVDAMTGVAGPLPQSSNGGRPSVELSIPMDVSSGSLAS